jgi:hypothetical protein
MIIVIAADPGGDPTPTLEDAEDCTRFHLEARGVDADAVATALSESGAGRLAGDDAFIARAAVERLAEGQVGADWPERFSGMIAYAMKKGWLDDHGAIQAHIEWRSAR